MCQTTVLQLAARVPVALSVSQGVVTEMDVAPHHLVGNGLSGLREASKMLELVVNYMQALEEAAKKKGGLICKPPFSINFRIFATLNAGINHPSVLNCTMTIFENERNTCLLLGHRCIHSSSRSFSSLLWPSAPGWQLHISSTWQCSNLPLRLLHHLVKFNVPLLHE